MRNLITLLLITISLSLSAQDYSITRYEQTGNGLKKSLFIAIQSNVTPKYIEHFFTTPEMVDSVTIKAAIAKLIAQLSISDSLYVPPPVVVDKIRRARLYNIDQDSIKAEKRRIRKSIKTEINDTIR